MRRYFIYSILAAFSLLSLGCEQLSENNSDIGQPFTVNATYDSGNSKATVVDGGTSVYWEPEDEINVFCGQASGKLVSTNVENSKTATFTGTVSGEVNPSTRNKLYALYPYREDASFDDGVITTILPEMQTAVAGSFDRNANIAVAISESTDLMFRNVCGGLRFTLTNPGIKRIVFESNGGEHIAGEFSAQFEDSVPVVKEVKNVSSKVILETEDGSAFETGVWYYMSFLPVTLTEGYNVTFITDTQSATLEVNKAQTVKRGTYGTVHDIDKNLEWKELEQYDYVIATDFVDWDSACFGRNGELIMLKDCSEEESTGRAYMLLPSEANGLDEFYASFDKNDVPEMVYINGMSIKVLSIQDGLADVLVNFGDTLNVLIDSLAVPFDEARTKSFSENNGVRNACAIAKLVIGVIEVGGGAVLVTASGASLPASGLAGIAGIYSGTTTVASGCLDVMGAYTSLFAPASQTYDGSLSNPIISTGININNQAFDYYISAIADEEKTKILNRSLDAGKLKTANSILAWLSNGIDWIDSKFGRTISERDRALMKYSGFYVITGVLRDKGPNWATVSAYVGPDPYSRSIHWECGIILYGIDGSHAHYDCPASGYFEHTFRGLKRGTSYVYQTYFHDKDNSFVFWGLPQIFETEGYSLSRVSDFEQTDATEGNFPYDGHTYKYKFECTITVNLDAINEHDAQVEDWGYVYKDPRGNIAKISLNGHSSPCRDSRYVFYRDESSSTACLYGYVQYADEECLYEEPHDYPLVYKGGEVCPDNNHVHAIDLGLSVKWACCNVGATKPEEYGGHYQWAGTQDVTSTSIYLDWSNCPYHTGSSSSTGWTKYIPSGESSYWFGPGSPDNKAVLNLGDDVAHVKLGGKWRMPTDEEFYELYNSCTSEWTTLNGVYGRKFTSRKNGNSIFLPAAGYRDGGILYDAGSSGSYWSSSLRTGDPYYAYDGYFLLGGVYKSVSYRYRGLSVRPVSE